MSLKTATLCIVVYPVKFSPEFFGGFFLSYSPLKVFICSLEEVKMAFPFLLFALKCQH